MSRGSCKFKQRDVTRALRGTVKAGIEVRRIEIDKEGKIVVVAGRPSPEGEPVNEWDNVS
jgi:predicted aspartyl protease